MLRTLLLTLMLASPAAAHEAGIGPNGGVQVDAGPYHAELVPAGTMVSIHVTTEDGSAADTAKMSGTAILLIGGKPVRAPLAPSAPGVLSADMGVAVPAGVKGAVQIMQSDGTTVQAKF